MRRMRPPDAPESLPPLRLCRLETAQLVDDHDREGPLAAQIIHQPDDVLPVDDVDVRRGGQSLLPLLGGSHDAGDAQVVQVLPLGRLLAPGVLRHALRSDDQDRPRLQAVVEQQVDGGQGGDRLARTHAPEEGTGRVVDDPVDASLLVRVGCEVHSRPSSRYSSSSLMSSRR